MIRQQLQARARMQPPPVQIFSRSAFTFTHDEAARAGRAGLS